MHAYALTPARNTAIGIAEVLVDEYFTQHGVCRMLLSDRGSQFMAALSTAVYEVMGIRKLYSTAYHPQTNGMVERFMQSLAQMLAMAVDTAHSDWHLWLNHVTFAYNSNTHASTGVTPFLLATGREPRIAIHHILQQIDDHVTSKVSPNISDLVNDLVTRQRLARSVVDRRHELKRQAVLAKNRELQQAFGFRHEFKAGERVWVYRKPITHEAVVSDTTDLIYRDAHADAQHKAAKVKLSRKFLDHWHGPYKVLAVGPATHDGAQVQRNVLYIEQDGRSVRVTAQLCKKCRDPTATSEKPQGLPSGFAKYLLVRHVQPIAPTSVTADDVTWESNRHGVEAILDHRVVTAARGRRSELQYKVRWEGDDVTDTWELMSNLDACQEAVHEYWTQVNTSGTTIRDGHTKVVRAKLRQVRSQSATADAIVRCGVQFYTLPAGIIALPTCPRVEVMCSSHLVNMRILQVYMYDEGMATQHTKWCEGVIRKAPVVGKYKGVTTHVAQVQFFEDNKRYHVDLKPSLYNTSFDAAVQSWFLLGTAAQISSLVH